MRTTKNKLGGLSAAILMSCALLVVAPVTPVHAQGNAAPAAAKPIADPSQAEVDALVKEMGLNESQKTVKELVPGWTKPKKMLVLIDRPERIAWLQKVAPGVKLIGVSLGSSPEESTAEALLNAADAEAFLFALPNKLCDTKVVAAAKKLKWIHTFGSGVDDCISEAPSIANGSILLTNSQKVLARSIAENPFAMMVTLMRGMDQMVRMDVKKKLENPNWGERGWTMEGRTLLVVGLGGIGTELAKMAHGIGMKVIATRNSNRQGPSYVDYVGLSDELPKLIGQADVVASTVPLTPETRGMFNTAMFNRMKRGTIFVSTSREDVFVRDDLIAALKSGQLGAAGVNANTVDAPSERQPLAPNDPMWDTPNFLYITHSAAPLVAVAGNDASFDRAYVVTREVLRRYVAGEKMLSVVDAARGY